MNAGIHVVIAAGNGAVDASDWSPARVSGGIAVGNVDINGVRSQSSNYGAPVAVFAPGVVSRLKPHVSSLKSVLISLRSLSEHNFSRD